MLPPYRYACKDLSVATTVSKKELDVTCWKRSSDALQLGAELIRDHDEKSNRAIFFYQWEAKDIQIRGSIDTDYTVGFNYFR